MIANALTSLLPTILALQEAAPAGPAGPADAAGQPSGMNPIFLVLMMVGIFYFVVFMPERKARKRQQELLASLSKGDKVMTTSGMLGTIVQVLDDVVVLQVDEGVRLKFTRAAVQTKLDAPEGEKDGKGDTKARSKDEAVAEKAS
jgi:preprotein translocase subunit YajC